MSQRTSRFVTGLALCAMPLLLGCQAMMYGTAEKLNRITVGMSRLQVVQELGQPDTTSASANDEVLKYKWMTSVLGWLPKWYFVRLVDGKVESFGEEREMSRGK